MSLSVTVAPWAADNKVLKVCEGVDDELRLCLDRSSDSDSQMELNQSLSELIESITCKDDSGDELPLPGGREIVSDIVERILDRVEEAASSRQGAELTDAREIDGEGSRDRGKSRHRKVESLRKVRRKRDRCDHERKKSRRRSTSCSTTSSACSDVSRKHRRKHKHHRRSVEDPSPRVNPIFLWVKQDDTRIVEVLCEDYDKRNRIRLTKTAHGWRAMPRTERLDSALSRSSVDLSPTSECPPSLVSPGGKAESDEPLQTKEKKPKRYVSRGNKRCDKKKDKSFNIESNYVDKLNNVDVVNNNNFSVSNNNNVKDGHVLSEPRLRSFGYKKACHRELNVSCKSKEKDNNMFEDVDVYTFVPTPKTDSEDNCGNEVSELEPGLKKTDLTINPTPQESECDLRSTELEAGVSYVKPDSPVVVGRVSESAESIQPESHHSPETLVDKPLECVEANVEPNIDALEDSCTALQSENVLNNLSDVDKINDLEKIGDVEPLDDNAVLQPNIVEHSTQEVLDNHTVEEPLPDPPLPSVTLEEAQYKPIHNVVLEPLSTKQDEPVENVPAPDVSNVTLEILQLNSVETEEEKLGDDCSAMVEERMEDEDPPPEIVLPEPHLQTPEPSPQPVPEPSITEPENSLADISLQPDTSLDSDTIHLPDTTTKSETCLLINTDISLGQKLSIKPHSEIMIESSLLSRSLQPDTKSVHSSEVAQHSQSDLKTASLLHQTELERQITADLDEDHLLAIEEILQGEECVEDFDDDDLPEEYSVSDDSPVNLVIDLKSKDQVDNTGIPLSLRTDDFLEIFPSPLPIKEHADVLPSLAAPKNIPDPVEKTIPPAHQQSKTKFLESILSCPKRCHKDNNKRVDSSDQQEPLYLGVSRKSASPTVSSSDGRKFSSPELEPKPKRMKVEDITLKTILNRNKDTFPKTKINKSKDNEETQQSADSTTKSRLLELLTNENEEHINKMDPLTQLKEVLSDPDLNVPDPLLVPRARLPALVANPAKEIPRLLAMKSENLSYPKLLTDPDLLVVSLSHLQSLLQAAGKDEEMLKYQQHAQLLQQQMKQEQPSFDAATATALNQMMWLPYLSQLEAAAMACGNTQDFMTMLNMVFPSGTYSQMSPYMMTPPSPGINAYDYKSQLEFQQAFALWNEAMMQAATNQFAAQSLSASNNSSNNNISSKLYQNYQETKQSAKQSHSNPLGKHQEPKHTSARTSPITLNYQQSKYRSSQYPYTSMFSIPTSTPTTSLSSASSTSYRNTHSSQSPQSYQSSRQRGYNYSNCSSLRPPSVTSSLSLPKPEPPSVSAMSTSDLFKSQQKHSSNSSCKSLMNILSKPKQSDVKSHSSRVYPTSTTMLPKETTIKLTPSVKQDPPKLKVKQPQHLVDPNSRPKLLNFDEHGEVGSTTGTSLTPQVDETHPNLWHPLFSSHQQKSYSSPWQWTTPVTVSGE